MKPTLKAGQLWKSCDTQTYYFVTGFRVNHPTYHDWVYCDNLNEKEPTGMSMPSFLNYCELISG